MPRCHHLVSHFGRPFWGGLFHATMPERHVTRGEIIVAGSSDSNNVGGLLEGLLVLDVSSFVAAPAAATVMADYGADVIKIEPPTGDPVRNLHKVPPLPECEHDYCYQMFGRNKRSLVLDLNDSKEWDKLAKLVAKADVVITNYPHRVVEKLRLTYNDLSPLNDRLIYAWVTGYGETGPEAGRPGFDMHAYWARSGLMDSVRDAEAPPAHSMPGMGDCPTAMSLFGAIMMALFKREQTGKGFQVGTSLMANGLWANSITLQAVLSGATFNDRVGRRDWANALTNKYCARDGRWLIVSLLKEEQEWERFLECVDRVALNEDPRFMTTEARHENAPALTALLDEAFAERDFDEWQQRFQKYRITAGTVDLGADIMDNEQALATDALLPMGDKVSGAEYTINSPIWVHGHEKLPPGAIPKVGEHTEEIEREFGLTCEDGT
jgi:crotonobetainyl-CoA:carnitine CoA-transferase CaiB-like acyl-CoA transferase